jgi:hypothetical protein
MLPVADQNPVLEAAEPGELGSIEMPRTVITTNSDQACQAERSRCRLSSPVFLVMYLMSHFSLTLHNS